MESLLESKSDPLLAVICYWQVDCTMQTVKTQQGLHYLLSQIYLHFYLKIMTCDPLIYRMDHPKCIESNQMEESISVYRVEAL